MLLHGHGANTVGRSMEQAVTNMIHLEHQAEMNFYAYNMAGPEHPYVSRELVIEFGSGGGYMVEPHFKQAVEKAGQPRYNGVWNSWYEDAASKLLKTSNY
jgi:ribulose-5-phosphate 4-epimerase/fuculose-1-phosphate aldolase